LSRNHRLVARCCCRWRLTAGDLLPGSVNGPLEIGFGVGALVGVLGGCLIA